MQIFVTAKTNAKEERVTKLDNTHFTVAVTELPKEGKANRAIVDALSEYFDIAQSRILLVSGFSSKQKVFEIL